MRCHVASLALASALLAGCVTAYQPAGLTGGYRDQKLEEDTYRVSFTGNGYTSREAVMKYWLYRCAEVTAQNGYDYFEIIAGQPRPGATGARAPYGLPDSLDVLPARVTGGAPVYTYIPGGTGATKWSASGVIRMYKGQVLDDSPITFVASEILALLGSDVKSGQPSASLPAQLRRLDAIFPRAPLQAGKSPDSDSGRAAEPAQSIQNRPVRLEDLKDLLPK